MEALAYSKELSIPRMELPLCLHYMKASANGFGSDQSRQEKMPFGAAAVCLSRRAFCSADKSAGSNLNVSFWNHIGLPPSTTITAATADLAYFPPLGLLCELDINGLVGGLLFHAGSFRSRGTSAAATSIIFRGRHFT